MFDAFVSGERSLEIWVGMIVREMDWMMYEAGGDEIGGRPARHKTRERVGR
jgi:hypothetical protein